MKRLLLLVIGAGLLVGCASSIETPSPQPEASPTISAPADGQFLSDLGFQHAPAGVSIPRSAVISEQVDQYNNVTLVFTAPSGVELASYLRASLTEQGFEITADANNSLLFERDPWQGAFTTEAGYSALSFRTDRER